MVFDDEGDVTFLSDGSLPGDSETEIVLTEQVPGGRVAAITVSVNQMTGYIRVLAR